MFQQAANRDKKNKKQQDLLIQSFYFLEHCKSKAERQHSGDSVHPKVLLKFNVGSESGNNLTVEAMQLL